MRLKGLQMVRLCELLEWVRTFEAVIVSQPSCSTVCREVANLMRSLSSVLTRKAWLWGNGARHRGHSGAALF